MDNSNSIPDSISCPEGSFPDENDICINCTNNCKNYELIVVIVLQVIIIIIFMTKQIKVESVIQYVMNMYQINVFT